MGEVSNIQWTDATWNPWHGCKKVSPGCKYCYMYREKSFYKMVPDVIKRSKTRFYAPKRWKEGRLIFTCSWSDWFIEEADPWRLEAWETIRQCPQHTFQILTKRPERIHEHLPPWFDAIADRVWIGVSIEQQKYVNRLEYLVDLPCITWASFEPLIEKIPWQPLMNTLDWVVIGGESGNDKGPWKYRPMLLDWAFTLVEGAIWNKVPCFMKQMGTYQAKMHNYKKHGGEWEDLPNSIRIRELPHRYHAIQNG